MSFQFQAGAAMRSFLRVGNLLRFGGVDVTEVGGIKLAIEREPVLR